MADNLTPVYVDSPFTLRQLIRSAYMSSFRDRFLNAERDIKHRVRVESVIVHKVKYVNNTPETFKVHTYRIRAVSVKDNGEVGVHPVTIMMDYLSIDAPVKIRCGKASSYTTNSTIKVKGICGDFYFKFMKLFKDIGILYNRDSTNHKKAYKANPGQEIGLCKHIWACIIKMVASNFFNGGVPQEKMVNKSFIDSLE